MIAYVVYRTNVVYRAQFVMFTQISLYIDMSILFRVNVDSNKHEEVIAFARERKKLETMVSSEANNSNN